MDYIEMDYIDTGEMDYIDTGVMLTQDIIEDYKTKKPAKTTITILSICTVLPNDYYRKESMNFEESEE